MWIKRFGWFVLHAEADGDGGEGNGADGDGKGAAADGDGKPPIVGDDGAKGDGKPAGEGDGKAKVDPPKVDWPDDWRTKAAGGDDKKLAHLARYASPAALADALLAAQNRIRSGDLKVAITKDSKPEEIAAYREAHGIPETADKYDLKGLDIDEGEKKRVDMFLTKAHGVHMRPDQVRASLEAYTEIAASAREERLAMDTEAKAKAEDKLHADWGPEFRTNISLLTNFLDMGPQGLRDKILHGRLADGTPIGSSPEALQWLVGLARERNPSGVVVPSGASTENAVSTRLEQIRKVMREDRKSYDRDEKMQAEYRQLVEWQHAQGRKAA